MASVKDSIDEAVAERLGFVKYPLYAIPVCATYELFKSGNMLLCYVVGGLTFWILLVALTKTIYNVSNGSDHLFPTFNILEFLKSFLKVGLAVFPIAGILGIIGYYLVQIQIPLDVHNIQKIYTMIVWALLGGILLTSVINYGKTEKIKDAYNPEIVYKYSFDILVAAIFLIPQIILVNAVLVGIIVYLFWLFYNFDNIFFEYFCSLLLVFNIAVIGNYFAQIGYENIVRKDEDNKDNQIS